MTRVSLRSAALAVSLFAATATASAPDPICGLWVTEDKLSVVHVYLEADGRLAGRIVAGWHPSEQDVRNPVPALRSRPLIGLKLMRGFVKDGGRGWKGGEIYDPDEGKTYKATARLSDKDAGRLLLRGYVGVPWFGRTEHWTRRDLPSLSACDEPQPPWSASSLGR